MNIFSGEADDAIGQFAAELDRALSLDHLRVVSSTAGGNEDALRRLEHGSGGDMAVVQVDATNPLGRDRVRSRLRYIARLYNKEFHILARRDIAALRELHGRKVNIDKDGTGTHTMARQVFEKLGIVPEFTTHDQATSLEKLRSGEIAAAVHVAPRPAREIADFPAEGRFHLLAVPFKDEVLDYLPAQFDARDYPNLIQGDTPVETLAVGTVLAVLDWPVGSERYKGLARFTNAYFSRFENLADAGHPKWGEATPSATVPGWQRFRPAQEWLKRRGQKP